MKKLKMILPLFAFIAGIFAAFATAPDTTRPVFRMVNGEWQEVTGTYYCKTAPEQVCTVLLENADPELGIIEQENHGQFSLTP